VCTNMIESMFDIVRTTTRNVKRWRNEGDMRRRWAAAQTPKPRRNSDESWGYRQIPQLVTMLNLFCA